MVCISRRSLSLCSLTDALFFGSSIIPCISRFAPLAPHPSSLPPTLAPLFFVCWKRAPHCRVEGFLPTLSPPSPSLLLQPPKIAIKPNTWLFLHNNKPPPHPQTRVFVTHLSHPPTFPQFYIHNFQNSIVFASEACASSTQQHAAGGGMQSPPAAAAAAMANATSSSNQ